MKRIFHILWFLFLHGATMAQSNTCNTATVLSECVVFSGNNTGATNGADDTYAPGDICATSIDNSVWFSFTPITSGAYTFELFNFLCFGTTALETGVFSGTCASLTPINCDASSSSTSVAFMATAGQTYFIVVDGTAGSSCTFDARICAGCNLNVGFTSSIQTGNYPLTVNFTNTSTGVHYSTWNFGLLAPGFDGTNATYTYNDPGTYVVSLVGYNGVCSDTITDTIVVTGPSAIEIPNVFTPNNDNQNDLFTVKCTGIKTLNVRIYNRWGELVGWWDGPKGWWDGYSALAGLPAVDGAYYYVIKAEGVDGTVFDEKGTLQLFR